MSNLIIKQSSNIDALKRQAEMQRVERVHERVVLAIDSSESMSTRDCGDKRRIDAVREAVYGFLEVCKPDISLVGAVVFNGDIVRVQRPTRNYSSVRSVLSGVEPQDGTSMYLATLHAIDIVSEGNADILRVILLSDGYSTEFRHTPEMVIQAAMRENVIIDTIAFGYDANQEALIELSEATGGTFKRCSLSVEELISTYKMLEVRVRGLLGGK